ncbi:MAG: trimethylamine methyltransferase family protein [Methanobacteriota archaeon]|nr:MAG: trimethylamine methyltransferase family protein [Euryarchaeota archaeon]
MTEEDFELIDRASISILEETGVAVYEKESLDVLESGGASVERSTSRVKIPEKLVRESIERLPRKVTLAGRDEARSVTLGAGESHFMNSLQGIKVLDVNTETIRPSMLQDVKMFARLVDYLDMIDIFGVTVVAHDVPGELHYLKELATAVENTGKHIIHGCHGTRMMKGFVRIAEVVSGGPEALARRPAISSFGCPVSPLQFDRANTESMVECAKAGMPYTVLSMAMAGASSPMSLAGNLSLINTEVLAGATICQLLNPGTPVIYGSVSSIMDMRTGVMALGAPERPVINTAVVEVAHSYGMPVWVGGMSTDGKKPGEQTMMEKIMTGLPPLLAGTDILFGAALLSSAVVYSPEQLVIDNEAAGALDRVRKGMNIDSEAIALDAIKKVGPGGGFLGMRQTLDYFKNDVWMPRLLDRNVYDNWQRIGRPDMRSIAREATKKILEEHSAKPLEDEQKKEIDMIVKGCSE